MPVDIALGAPFICGDGLVDAADPCDDGNSCSTSDVCNDGTCVGGPIASGCRERSDCIRCQCRCEFTCEIEHRAHDRTIMCTARKGLSSCLSP